MIHLYCGSGKGKTTAAAGLCVRMSGNGGKVLFVQLLKDGTSAEIKSLVKLGVKVLFCDKPYGFWNTLTDEEKTQLRQCHNENLDYAISHMNEYDMIVLDEMCAAYALNAVDRIKVRSFVKKCTAELVITGREPDGFFIEHADYISEIKCIRHPYEKGISARPGIEY